MFGLFEALKGGQAAWGSAEEKERQEVTVA